MSYTISEYKVLDALQRLKINTNKEAMQKLREYQPDITQNHHDDLWQIVRALYQGMPALNIEKNEELKWKWTQAAAGVDENNNIGKNTKLGHPFAQRDLAIKLLRSEDKKEKEKAGPLLIHFLTHAAVEQRANRNPRYSNAFQKIKERIEETHAAAQETYNNGIFGLANPRRLAVTEITFTHFINGKNNLNNEQSMSMILLNTGIGRAVTKILTMPEYEN